MPDKAAEIALMESDTPQGPARIGRSLREVRERLGWKLPDVAAALRIRESFLDAIERGDLEALPGFAYQSGFVRSYAQILGLDPDEILRRFQEEGAGIAPKEELRMLSPVPDRGVPSGAIILLGVVLLLGGYGLWFLHSTHERELAQAVPPVPAELAPLALPPAKPDTPAPPPAAATPVTKPAAVTPVLAPVAPAVAPNPPSSAPPAPPATSSSPPGETIFAAADTWVEVTDASGNILFSRVLHTGESWPVPDEPGLTLTTGNAGGTEIATNGKTGAPLGAPGVVLHNYLLTPPAAAKPPTPQAATP
jgi:cytoskeleton protein RodZ